MSSHSDDLHIVSSLTSVVIEFECNFLCFAILPPSTRLLLSSSSVIKELGI